MKFRQYGYTEKKVEVRKMTMGAITLTIAQGLIAKDVKDMEIRIVDCFSAEIEIYNGLDALLSKDWCAVFRCKMQSDRYKFNYLWTQYAKRNHVFRAEKLCEC